MPRLLKLVFLICLLPSLSHAQGFIAHIDIVSSAPSGNCLPNDLELDSTDRSLYACPASGTWPTLPTLQGSVVITGMITMITTGTCGTGWTEVSALNGVMLRGTIAANNDVGNTGGNATITPTGTISQPTLSMNAYTPAGSVAAPTFSGVAGTVPAETFTGNAGTVPAETFTGNAGTVPAETFTGNALATHTHTLTPTGTNGASATSGNCAATNIAAGTGSTTACKATAPNLTVTAQGFTGALDTSSAVSAGTPAGSNGTAAFTPAGSNSTASFTPAGSNSTASFTPAGTNSAPAFSGNQATLTGTVTQPTFNGNAIDPSPPYLKVIFCSKN